MWFRQLYAKDKSMRNIPLMLPRPCPRGKILLMERSLHLMRIANVQSSKCFSYLCMVLFSISILLEMRFPVMWCRQFAQRSRVRKLQYISELERNVQALQASICTVHKWWCWFLLEAYRFIAVFFIGRRFRGIGGDWLPEPAAYDPEHGEQIPSTASREFISGAVDQNL